MLGWWTKLSERLTEGRLCFRKDASMHVLAGLTIAVALFVAQAKSPVTTKPDPAFPLKPGDFIWHPERSTEGPVVVIVSIPEQKAFVYRNGIRIGQSTVSTGRPGHATPNRRLHHPAERHQPSFEHVQQRADAVHGTPDVGRHCAACRKSAGLSRVARMRAPPARVLEAAVWSHRQEHDDRDRRQELRA